MAAVTNAGSIFNTTAGDKTVTATPAAGDLIVCLVAATGATGTVGALSVTDNNTDGKGTYAKVGASFTGFSTAGAVDVWIRNALVGSATSTVFTFTQTGSTGGGGAVYRISGMSIVGLGAVRGAGGQSTGTAATTPAPVLLRRVGTTFTGGTQAALTGNPLVGIIGNGTNPAALTPPATFTEAPTPDLGYATPTTGMENVFVNSGITASTITWGGASGSQFASLAVELDASVPQYDWVSPGKPDKDANRFIQGPVGRSSTWMQGLRREWTRAKSGILVPELGF